MPTFIKDIRRNSAGKWPETQGDFGPAGPPEWRRPWHVRDVDTCATVAAYRTRDEAVAAFPDAVLLPQDPDGATPPPTL